MAENKTKPTEVDPKDFIAAVPDPQRRADADTVCAMMEKMWGPSIIGFGAYHYRYASGREGTICRIGFSPRARELVLYLVDSFEGKEDQLARLGKHRIGKSCLYIKKLSDVDEAVLEEMVIDSLADMDKKFPRDRDVDR
jgi:hypothetical protein